MLGRKFREGRCQGGPGSQGRPGEISEQRDAGQSDPPGCLVGSRQGPGNGTVTRKTAVPVPTQPLPGPAPCALHEPTPLASGLRGNRHRDSHFTKRKAGPGGSGTSQAAPVPEPSRHRSQDTHTSAGPRWSAGGRGGQVQPSRSLWPHTAEDDRVLGALWPCRAVMQPDQAATPCQLPGAPRGLWLSS